MFRKPLMTRKNLIDLAARNVYSLEKFKEDDYPTCAVGKHTALFWTLWNLGGPELVREVNQLVLDEIAADRDWNKRYEYWNPEKIWKRSSRWNT